MKVGPEEFGDEVSRPAPGGSANAIIIIPPRRVGPHMSSSGEMKMSLRLMTLGHLAIILEGTSGLWTHIFMTEVLQQLEFPVRPLRQHGGTEGFHDFLDRNRLPGQLILGRAFSRLSSVLHHRLNGRTNAPYQPKSSHPHRLQVGIPELLSATCQNITGGIQTDRLVISKVVPKIWARTNSAIAVCGAVRTIKVNGEGEMKSILLSERLMWILCFEG